MRGGRTEPFIFLRVVRECFGDEVDDGDEEVSRRCPPFIVLLDLMSSGGRCRLSTPFWGVLLRNVPLLGLNERSTRSSKRIPIP